MGDGSTESGYHAIRWMMVCSCWPPVPATGMNKQSCGQPQTGGPQARPTGRHPPRPGLFRPGGARRPRGVGRRQVGGGDAPPRPALAPGARLRTLTPVPIEPPQLTLSHPDCRRRIQPEDLCAVGAAPQAANATVVCPYTPRLSSTVAWQHWRKFTLADEAPPEYP